MCIRDSIYGEEGADTIFGAQHGDSIAGGAGNDLLTGGMQGAWSNISGVWQFMPGVYSYLDDGDDILEGGLGDDTFVAWFGDDQIRVGGNAVQDYIEANEIWNAAVLKELADKASYDADIAVTNASRASWDTAELIEYEKQSIYQFALSQFNLATSEYDAAVSANAVAQSALSTALSNASSANATLTTKTTVKDLSLIHI